MRGGTIAIPWLRRKRRLSHAAIRSATAVAGSNACSTSLRYLSSSSLSTVSGTRIGSVVTRDARLHGTGKANLVATMARAAVAAGADGLIVEVHPDPEKALSDGYQSLTPKAFVQMMAECRKVAQALGRRM